jgi:hypothetical protein
MLINFVFMLTMLIRTKRKQDEIEQKYPQKDQWLQRMVANQIIVCDTPAWLIQSMFSLALLGIFQIIARKISSAMRKEQNDLYYDQVTVSQINKNLLNLRLILATLTFTISFQMLSNLVLFVNAHIHSVKFTEEGEISPLICNRITNVPELDCYLLKLSYFVVYVLWQFVVFKIFWQGNQTRQIMAPIQINAT